MFAQLKEFITKENEKLCQNLEVREARLEARLEERLATKLGAKFEQELDKKIEELKKETKQEMQEIREALFVLEHEHGRKIDAIYDALMIHQEKNDKMSENIGILDKRTEKNEMNIFNHEKRISALETVNS